MSVQRDLMKWGMNSTPLLEHFAWDFMHFKLLARHLTPSTFNNKVNRIVVTFTVLIT